MMLDVSFIPTPLFLIDSSYFIVAKSKAVILSFPAADNENRDKIIFFLADKQGKTTIEAKLTTEKA